MRVEGYTYKLIKTLVTKMNGWNYSVQQRWMAGLAGSHRDNQTVFQERKASIHISYFDMIASRHLQFQITYTLFLQSLN